MNFAQWIASLLIILASFSANAIEPREFVEAYAQRSQFQNAEFAYQLCEEIFETAGSVAYENRIRQLGDLWPQYRDGAYMALSTCHTMWISKYLDPIRVSQVTRKDRAMIANLVAGAEMLYTQLPEEIRLYLNILPKDTSIPKSPYEVLAHMASTERQLHETLHREMRMAANSIAAAPGYLAATLKGTKAFTSFIGGASEVAGRLAKQALLVTVLAYGAGELAETGLWYMRESNLTKHANELAAKLLKPDGAPLSILFDEFFRAQERLGFFYNYDFYMAENGATHVNNAVSRRCVKQVKKYFESGTPLAPCRDAASTWILAAEFLKTHFQGQPDAIAIADRLFAKAKRAFWQYQETEAYKMSLPVCHPIPSATILFAPLYECTDTSGRVVI